MALRIPVPPFAQQSPTGEQRLLLHGVSWESYLKLSDALELPGLRITYLGGSLELMSPSRLHETTKKLLARLLELYALERDVALYAYGSTTFRREAKMKGVEPDECYVLGHALEDTPNDVPDLAIEVIFTSGGLNKLEVYLDLGVAEVWLCRRGTNGRRTIEVHQLRDDGGEPRYEVVERSGLLPDLDVTLLAELAAQHDQHAAVKAFRDHLRGAAVGRGDA